MTQHLGILGGGQLGRMLALAARPLGIEVTVLDPNPESPARAAAAHIVAAYDDEAALSQLADCDVVTFEFENVPDEAAARLAQKQAVYPPADALRVSQDRWTEKSLFTELGIPTARFMKVESAAHAEKAFAELGPLVFKTRRFGYDGKGQAVVRDKKDLLTGFASLGGAPAIAEELVPFDRELSVIACRGRDGQVVIYPLTQNTHVDGILRTSIAPAPNVSAAEKALATEVAEKLLNHLSYVGVLALELFEVGGTFVANEFAPRVHNSGHWTIEGAITSQFENHVRAVCGLPLGCPDLRCPSVMTNLIGDIPDRTALLALQDSHLHDYAKASRAGRKVGHVTSLGTTAEEALARATSVSALIP